MYTFFVVFSIVSFSMFLLMLRAFAVAVKDARSNEQGSLLYDVTRHERADQLKAIFINYQHLEDPDWDSFIKRSIERMIENLKKVALNQHLFIQVGRYNDTFFSSLTEELQKKMKHTLLHEPDFISYLRNKAPGVKLFGVS